MTPSTRFDTQIVGVGQRLGGQTPADVAGRQLGIHRPWCRDRAVTFALDQAAARCWRLHSCQLWQLMGIRRSAT
jgi:hypothetical protein